jgi:hypothetical protein
VVYMNWFMYRWSYCNAQKLARCRAYDVHELLNVEVQDLVYVHYCICDVTVVYTPGCMYSWRDCTLADVYLEVA